MEERQDLESCCNKKQMKMQHRVEVQQGVQEDVISSYPAGVLDLQSSVVVGSLFLRLKAFQFCPLLTRHHFHQKQVVDLVPIYEESLRGISDKTLEGFFAESRINDQFTVHDEYQGEAIVHDGQAYRTLQYSAGERCVAAKPHSVGPLLHSQVLHMIEEPTPSEETVASFRATFVFSIENSLPGETSGSGFAFVMVPAGNVMQRTGRNLGVMDSDKDDFLHTFVV